MNIIPLLLKEMDEEASITRKMLGRVPNDKYDWQPHEKSMTIKQLATHIAELPGWAKMAMNTDGLDFENNPYQPEDINNTTDLLAYFEKELAAGKAELEKANEGILKESWTLRAGEHVIRVFTKYETVRVSIAQTIHHRAQLGVYFRLLGIPVPASYGPSADEN